MSETRRMLEVFWGRYKDMVKTFFTPQMWYELCGELRVAFEKLTSVVLFFICLITLPVSAALLAGLSLWADLRYVRQVEEDRKLIGERLPKPRTKPVIVLDDEDVSDG